MVTATNFKLQFPEFSEIPDTYIDTWLADAYLCIDATIWGPKTDLGAKFLAAHLMANMPAGRNAQLSTKDGKSTYGAQYDELVEQVSGGFRGVLPRYP